MIRATGAVFAAALFLAPAALASESRLGETPSITVRGDAQTIHAKLVEAAATVCKAARAQDPSGDFGSQQECVANTIDGAYIVGNADKPVRWAAASSFLFDW